MPATAVPAAQAGEHSGAPTPAVAPESAGLQRKPALQECWLVRLSVLQRWWQMTTKKTVGVLVFFPYNWSVHALPARRLPWCRGSTWRVLWRCPGVLLPRQPMSPPGPQLCIRAGLWP